ncbi:hypothetical protein EYF80_018487 [Liparis tanakae]|uniref:Uncharacterized protein n=1 Tax=Liparis tanakae TaxID=230148 RepID=A0A4Z2I134_9TELE|nr:hypothetical protein EYF80_018487 [Liparis tanakae]
MESGYKIIIGCGRWRNMTRPWQEKKRGHPSQIICLSRKGEPSSEASDLRAAGLGMGDHTLSNHIGAGDQESSGNTSSVAVTSPQPPALISVRAAEEKGCELSPFLALLGFNRSSSRV